MLKLFRGNTAAHVDASVDSPKPRSVKSKRMKAEASLHD